LNFIFFSPHFFGRSSINRTFDDNCTNSFSDRLAGTPSFTEDSISAPTLEV
jgi:hypothetical protein